MILIHSSFPVPDSAHSKWCYLITPSFQLCLLVITHRELRKQLVANCGQAEIQDPENEPRLQSVSQPAAIVANPAWFLASSDQVSLRPGQQLMTSTDLALSGLEEHNITCQTFYQRLRMAPLSISQIELERG